MNTQTQDHSEKVKALQKIIIQPPKVQLCPEHQLPKEHFCLTASCKEYLVLKCQECYKLNSHFHKSINLRKIGPMLSKWLGESWELIRKENMQIEREWNICEVNINYCFDILNQVKKMINSRKLHELPVFDFLISFTSQINGGKLTTEAMLDRIDKLQKKYNLFQGEKIDGDCLDQDRQFRKNKWASMGSKTKKFSEQALAFSQTLAKTIEDKLKYERRIKRLENLAQQRIFNLNELIKNSKNAEEINNLKIEVNNPKQSETIEDILKKCENLKSLTINNKNGKIIHKNWKIITHKLEYLNRLRQLKLTLRLEDLLILTKLFKEHPNSVRYIEVLHLTITDEPKLDMKYVAEFCNTLQLREASLTLTRDNITGMNFKEFLDIMRVSTSLSQLPMNLLNINLAKNKITELSDKSYCEANFFGKCKNVKTKNLMF